MNLIAHYSTITEIMQTLKFESSYDGTINNTPYYVKNLNLLRQNIVKIQHIPFINDIINKLKTSWLFKSTIDSGFITSPDDTNIKSFIVELKNKLDLLKIIIEASPLLKDENLLIINIPELKSFEDLTKLSKDLKKSIEIPILNDEINGRAEIVGADKGSFILYITLGSIFAIKLIAGICWAAAVVRKKNADAKIFEQHARTLELKNESLSNFVEAQKTQLKNILDSEAHAIAQKHYTHEDPETIERLKLSISTVSDLIDKGVKILPNSTDTEIQNSFPDYNKLNIIESSIKQITE
jgi:hypothetical protein